MVVDRKTRKRILKPVFRGDEVAGQPYDVVVVGSGMGGLSAAVLLARAGRRVLVLEQHGKIGGCCHTFGTGGVEFDTGVHYLGEMQPNNMISILFNQLTEGQVVMHPMHSPYDVAVFEDKDGTRHYPMEKGKTELKAMFLKSFPEEKEAIEKYFKYLQEVRKGQVMSMVLKILPLWLSRFLASTGLVHWMTSYYRLSAQTVQQVLDSLTDNQQLKAAMCYIFGDAGLPPADCSFVMHGNLVSHYMYGAFYPKNGTSEVPFQLLQVIEKNGGTVCGKASVSNILFDESGHVSGVRVKSKEGEVDIPTKVVVSDVGVMNTLNSLLPPEVAQKTTVWPMLKSLKQSVSCISAFVTLEGTAAELGLKASNTWVYQSSDLSQATHDYLNLGQEDLAEKELPLLFISFPSCKDPTWELRHPDKSSCVIITLSRWEWFEEWQDQKCGKREQRYKDLKTAIGRRMWSQLLRHFPQLDGKMLAMDVGTPLSNKHYLGQAQGEMYGLDHDPHRFSPEMTATLRPDIGVPGLYLTGQDIVSCGFPAAMFGGLLCASAILNRYLIWDLVQLQKELKKKKKQTSA